MNSDDRGSTPSGLGGVVAALVLGYIGVYLCRKNLAVAIPILREQGADRAELGRLVSLSTLAYAAGKLVLSPLVDRIGGRAGFLISLALVALFGALGAFAPGLGLLALFYGLNRFTGAAAWGAMMSLVPGWTPARIRGTVTAILSLSYVAGGALALILAKAIVDGGYGWRGVMGLPSAALVLILVPCFWLVRRGPLVDDPASTAGPTLEPLPPLAERLRELLSEPRFLVVLALSFTLTLMREAFNTWSVDFLSTLAKPGTGSVGKAALQSIGFDLMGAVSILAMGVLYDRTRPEARRFLLAGTLALLAGAIAILPAAGRIDPLAAAAAIGLVGLLVYGPYSLLAGVLAVESGGARQAATAAGLIDALGYLAGVLSGVAFGALVDRGGYATGFGALALLTVASAGIALGLKPRT